MRELFNVERKVCGFKSIRIRVDGACFELQSELFSFSLRARLISFPGHFNLNNSQLLTNFHSLLIFENS